MTRSTTPNPLHIYLLATSLLLQLTHAQIGTITQDIYNLSAFPLQKLCAQTCFVDTDYCPNDVIGDKLGCKTHTDCRTSNWQATNDCYCRTDVQKPAQDFLTSCIQRRCTVGDARIDASSAGSLYAQYCAEKGYNPDVPATVPATATGANGASTGTVAGGGGGGGGPTASPTSDSQSSSSGSNSLSTATIIGIAVGALAGLALLSTLSKIISTRLERRRRKAQQPPPIYQQAVFPSKFHPGPDYRDSELTPEDSFSVASWMPRPAPTLVSNAQGFPPYR